MELNGLQDLRQRKDKFTIRYAEGGSVKVATLKRESPKVKELAYYSYVISEKHKNAFDVENMSDYVEWIDDIKDELFIYFCDENKWLTRETFDKMAPEDIMEIINKIVEILTEIADGAAEEKKKDEEKPWESFAANIGRILESTGKSLVEIREWPFYVLQQEMDARSMPKSEEQHKAILDGKEKEKPKTMSARELLPF